MPWVCGEHPGLGCSHDSLYDHLREVHMPSEISPPPSSPPVEYPMPKLISRQRNKSTSEVIRNIFTHMSEHAHGTVFGGEASWVGCPVVMDIAALRGALMVTQTGDNTGTGSRCC